MLPTMHWMSHICDAQKDFVAKRLAVLDTGAGSWTGLRADFDTAWKQGLSPSKWTIASGLSNELHLPND